MSWLLRLYPARWRQRYGDEFQALVERQPLSAAVVLDILRGALDAWLRPQLASSRQAAPAGAAPPAARHTRFDKFTPRSRSALQSASDEARLLNAGFISTEHLLLGLLRDPDSVAARVLENLNVAPSRLRSAIQTSIGSAAVREPPTHGLTPGAKRAIELGVDEARRTRCRYVGTEHLLLGLVREGQGIAATVLADLTGADLATVRRTVAGVLNAGPRPGPWRSGPGTL
jgi:hypothetical protein